MGKQQAAEKLAKFLDYMLGRRPDEFGLVPDEEGFVKTKELLKAFHEEDGWRHVRQAHLNEVLLTLPKRVIEIDDNRIRAANRDHLPKRQLARDLPKLLYTFLRQRAYPVALEKGILPSGRGKIVLTADKKLAERMGTRRDASPVILTVSVQKMHDQGKLFLSAGPNLFLTNTIPPDCFTGPPLPKEKAEMKSTAAEVTGGGAKQPGSVFPSFGHDIGHASGEGKPGRKKRGAEWKKDRKKLIRIKRKKGLPF